MGPLYFHRYDPALGCVVGIRNCECHDTQTLANNADICPDAGNEPSPQAS